MYPCAARQIQKLFCGSWKEASVRRVSNRSQQGLFRGETLNLTRKNAKAAFFIDCLCRRWRHVRKFESIFSNIDWNACWSTQRGISLEVNFQILIEMRAWSTQRGIKMEFILYEQKGNIAIITINREKALNALNSQVLDELNGALDAVNLNEVRCLILTGAGQKSFVAGADIGEMSTLTKAEGEAFGKKGNDVFRRLETFPIPVIAAVNGFALGGGCEISMSCDIRICSDNAVFGQPEVGLGITPGFGGTQRLARLVGAGMAKQMIYTARNIKAADAYRIGLVNEVYSAEIDGDGNVVKTAQEVLMAAAEKMAAGIAKNAPIAVRNCKKAINEGLDVDMDEAIVIEEKLFGDCFETEDQKYGMAFFLDKNKEKVKEPFKNC